MRPLRKFEQLHDIVDELRDEVQQSVGALEPAFLAATRAIEEIIPKLALLEKAREGTCGVSEDEALGAWGITTQKHLDDMWAKAAYDCPECKKKTLHYYTTDGDFQDTHFRCLDFTCRHEYWVDGPDA